MKYLLKSAKGLVVKVPVIALIFIATACGASKSAVTTQTQSESNSTNANATPSKVDSNIGKGTIERGELKIAR